MANGEQELETDFELFCWDARKFMISNGSVIARNPLQIYCSALIFSPKNSLVCQASSKERSSWLSEYRSPHEQWDQCILKIPTSRTALAVQSLIAFSPDSSKIAYISDYGVEIWSVKSGISIASLAENFNTRNLLFSPDGKHLALIVDAASIWLYDTVARTLDHVLKTPGHAIEEFSFSPNGSFLVSISEDQMHVWTVAEAVLHWTLTAGEHHCTLAELAKSLGPGLRETVHFHTLEISNDSSLIATVSSDNIVKLWNVEMKSLHSQIPLEGFGYSTTLGFSANHNLIIVQETKVTSWDYKSNKANTATLSIRHPDHSESLDSDLSHWLSPDGSILAISTDMHDLFLFNTTTGEFSDTKITSESLFTSLCFSSSSTRVALQTMDDEVIFYDIMSLDRIGTFPFNPFCYHALLFSPDWSMLAHVGNHTTIWDVSTMSRKSVREQGSRISHTLLSVDGTKVLCASQRFDKPTVLCVLDVLQDLSTIIESNLRVENLSISSDNNYVLAQGADNSNVRRTYLYNVCEKTSLDINSVGATAFSNSSRLLAIAGLDFKIRIWDLQFQEYRSTLVGHSCRIEVLKFSPNDAKVASIDVAGNTMVWDYRSSGLQAVFPRQPGHGLPINGADIAFSSDGSMLACILSQDCVEAGYGYLWGLETNILLEEFTAQQDRRKRVLSFSDDGRYLRTHRATIDLLPFASPCLDVGQPLSFTDADNWIRWHGRKVLRLPDGWWYAEHDSWGNKLAIGTVRREVAFIEFDPQELRMALGI